MTETLLKVDNLKVYFPFQQSSFHRKKWLKAVDEISFSIDEGEVLGIVGESGCGKSSLAKTIAGLLDCHEGEIIWQGQNITRFSQQQWRPLRQDIQMIFQDPVAALNPRMTVGSIISEPLKNLIIPALSQSEIHNQVENIMNRTGLSLHLINRYPHELSSGQCQRVGIARALIIKPKLVICDEPVSALDVSIQSQIIELLAELKKEMQLSLIFISHDLQVVRDICDRVMVMYLGKKMESAPANQLYETPLHPYSQALLSAIPIPDPNQKSTFIPLIGELPSPVSPPKGCVFHTRCPLAEPKCKEELPGKAIFEKDHQVFCIKANPIN